MDPHDTVQDGVECDDEWAAMHECDEAVSSSAAPNGAKNHRLCWWGQKRYAELLSLITHTHTHLSIPPSGVHKFVFVIMFYWRLEITACIVTMETIPERVKLADQQEVPSESYTAPWTCFQSPQKTPGLTHTHTHTRIVFNYSIVWHGDTLAFQQVYRHVHVCVLSPPHYSPWCAVFWLCSSCLVPCARQRMGRDTEDLDTATQKVGGAPVH